MDNVTELCKMIWLLTKSGDYVRYLKEILSGKSPSIIATSDVSASLTDDFFIFFLIIKSSYLRKGQWNPRRVNSKGLLDGPILFTGDEWILTSQ